jgi:hypothetical protein
MLDEALKLSFTISSYSAEYTDFSRTDQSRAGFSLSIEMLKITAELSGN